MTTIPYQEYATKSLKSITPVTSLLYQGEHVAPIHWRFIMLKTNIRNYESFLHNGTHTENQQDTDATKKCNNILQNSPTAWSSVFGTEYPEAHNTTSVYAKNTIPR